MMGGGVGHEMTESVLLEASPLPLSPSHPPNSHWVFHSLFLPPLTLIGVLHSPLLPSFPPLSPPLLPSLPLLLSFTPSPPSLPPPPLPTHSWCPLQESRTGVAVQHWSITLHSRQFEEEPAGDHNIL